MTTKPATSTVGGVNGYQRIDGFGCSTKPFNNSDMFNTDVVTVPAADQTAILTFLFSPAGMGLTRMRGLVREPATGYEIEPANDNADPLVTNEAALSYSRIDATSALDVAARPLGLTMSWYSPVNRPTWMGDGASNFTTSVAEYSEWLLIMARRFANQGAPAQYISVANEPSYTRNRMSGAQMRDVILTLAPRLAAEGLLVPFIISDDVRASDTSTTIAPILANPTAKSYVAAIATHLYDEALSNLTPLVATAAANNLPLWMTEMSTFSLDTVTGEGWTGTAIQWATLMHKLLVDYNVAAIDYLWGWFGEEDFAQLVRLDHTGTTYDGYVVKDVAYHMGQWSKFVRPGARRVDASATGVSLVSAFLSDTARVVVAVNNTGSSLTPTITAAMLSGLSTLTATRSSTTEQWASLPAVTVSGSTISPTLPANSVTTFVG